MIELNNVTKIYNPKSKYNRVVALDDVSLKIDNNKIIGIFGESGSGKTTLLNIIGGLDSPSSGSISINNEDISKFSEIQLAKFRNINIGYIFQDSYLDLDMTSLENVEIPMIIKGEEKESRQKRAVSLLKKLGLESKIYERTGNLSGGQRQRVSIARALANNPKIILADEPTGNLDSKTGESVMKILKNLSDTGVLIVLVSHKVSDKEYCDRIIEICDGKIIYDKN